MEFFWRCASAGSSVLAVSLHCIPRNELKQNLNPSRDPFGKQLTVINAINQRTSRRGKRTDQQRLKRLAGLDYVPYFGDEPVNGLLSEIGLTFETLSDLNSEDLTLHLKKFDFDWENLELFADFLAKLSKTNPTFKEKATSIYNFIQSESKTFSYGIVTKIAQLK